MEANATQQLYWNDTYAFESEAKVVGVEDTGNGGFSVILDSTIFYPQGGGQPADSGEIKSSSSKFNVKDVRMKTSQVIHIGSFEGDPFKVGDVVHLSIDSGKRRLHAKLHSAGHLIDVALENIGYRLEPGKGYHFPNGAYVEYKGSIPANKREEAKIQLAQELTRLIQKGSEVKVQIAPYEKIGELCGNVPSYLPKDQEARIVTLIGDKGCPCGGTHVKDIKDIGNILIRKLQVKGETTRIGYDVE